MLTYPWIVNPLHPTFYSKMGLQGYTLVSFFALKDKLWVFIKIKAFISIGVLIWKVQEVPSTAFSEKPEGGETHLNRKQQKHE